MDKYMDYVCAGAIGLTFLMSVPWGRRVWWMVDCCVSFVFGLALLLVPQVFLGFQVVGKLNALHAFLARLVGAALVGGAAAWYRSRASVDHRMFGNLLFSRIVGCTFLLVAQCYSAYHLWKRSGMRFNEKFVWFSCLGVGAWWVGSAVQLARGGEIGGYVYRRSWLHAGCLVDHYLLLVVGVINFAFPTHILKLMVKPEFGVDGVHVCLTRCVAALLVAQSLASNSAPGFLYSHDKKNHIIGRLLMHSLGFGAALYGHFAVDLFTMYHVTPFMLCGFYITFLLSLYFRFGKDQKEKQ